MSNEESIKEVIELLHELKLELVAEMDYASLELQSRPSSTKCIC